MYLHFEWVNVSAFRISLESSFENWTSQQKKVFDTKSIYAKAIIFVTDLLVGFWSEGREGILLIHIRIHDRCYTYKNEWKQRKGEHIKIFNILSTNDLNRSVEFQITSSNTLDSSILYPLEKCQTNLRPLSLSNNTVW